MKRTIHATLGALGLALAAPACLTIEDDDGTLEAPLGLPPGAGLEAIDDDYASPGARTLVAGDVPGAPTGPEVITAEAGVIDNDVTGGAAVAAVLDVPPAHGSLHLEEGGGFVYKPHERARKLACGDHFRYHLKSAAGSSNQARVDIDFDNPLCRRFVWLAYEDQPYIYKGCPDPETWVTDPEPIPWRDTPIIIAAPRAEMIEVELASEAPLQVAIASAPRTGEAIASARGFTFIPGDAAPVRERVALRISSGACTYHAEAELVIGE